MFALLGGAASEGRAGSPTVQRAFAPRSSGVGAIACAQRQCASRSSQLDLFSPVGAPFARYRRDASTAAHPGSSFEPHGGDASTAVYPGSSFESHGGDISMLAYAAKQLFEPFCKFFAVVAGKGPANKVRRPFSALPFEGEKKKPQVGFFGMRRKLATTEKNLQNGAESCSKGRSSKPVSPEAPIDFAEAVKGPAEAPLSFAKAVKGPAEVPPDLAEEVKGPAEAPPDSAEAPLGLAEAISCSTQAASTSAIARTKPRCGEGAIL